MINLALAFCTESRGCFSEILGTEFTFQRIKELVNFMDGKDIEIVITEYYFNNRAYTYRVKVTGEV